MKNQKRYDINNIRSDDYIKERFVAKTEIKEKIKKSPSAISVCTNVCTIEIVLLCACAMQ